MKTIELAFHGIGHGHEAFLQLHRSRYAVIAMAKDQAERVKLDCWQVCAAVMAELSKSANPEDSDHEYWTLIADQIDMIKRVVKANPNWYQIPRRSRDEVRNSWLPPELLRAGGIA